MALCQLVGGGGLFFVVQLVRQLSPPVWWIRLDPLKSDVCCRRQRMPSLDGSQDPDAVDPK